MSGSKTRRETTKVRKLAKEDEKMVGCNHQASVQRLVGSLPDKARTQSTDSANKDHLAIATESLRALVCTSSGDNKQSLASTRLLFPQLMKALGSQPR